MEGYNGGGHFSLSKVQYGGLNNAQKLTDLAQVKRLAKTTTLPAMKPMIITPGNKWEARKHPFIR